MQAIVLFVQKPTMKKALMKRPVAKLGLMPANSVSLPEKDLVNIATYIFEENFALPCKHWEIAVRNAEAKGEVDAHIEKDKMKLQRFCAE